MWILSPRCSTRSMNRCAPCPNTPMHASRHVRGSPWACCMSSMAWATGLLSLADARLSSVVSQLTRADPPLSPLHDASGLDPGLLGLPDGARGHRHVWDRGDPSHARRPESPTNRPQRPLESSLDCRGQTLSVAQSVGVGGGVGVCHRQCRG